MKVIIRLEKTFERLEKNEGAKYLNKGDIFLPHNTGWEYKVVNKVMCRDGDEYVLEVVVKPTSRGAKIYAKDLSVRLNQNT